MKAKPHKVIINRINDILINYFGSSFVLIARIAEDISTLRVRETTKLKNKIPVLKT